MKKQNKNKGFAQIVFLAIVIIGALAYFNIDLRTIFDTIFGNPVVRGIWHIFVVAWVSFIKPLLVFLVASIVGLFN